MDHAIFFPLKQFSSLKSKVHVFLVSSLLSLPILSPEPSASQSVFAFKFFEKHT